MGETTEQHEAPNQGRLGQGRAYAVDAFLSSPEQASFTIGFAQTNE